MKDYKKLRTWQKAHQLALLIYQETKSFPDEEKYGITNQMRRAAVSVPTNIAEGCGKFTQLDLVRYLQIALGSAQELEYLNLLSTELKMQKKDIGLQIDRNANELKAMLITLIKKIRMDSKPKP